MDLRNMTQIYHQMKSTQVYIDISTEEFSAGADACMNYKAFTGTAKSTLQPYRPRLLFSCKVLDVTSFCFHKATCSETGMLAFEQKLHKQNRC